ncbi:hypothetical protein [Acidisoma silvae]|uniref:Uncharacterized protein n=1 Tax=Acidisoma silvae TaxID=2802396 RepID=A0A964E1B7_9PROT|nr:hypothetical protein [Acidisoma silvae]MCB8877593.1 hypothetical protein [Acidisoma silvae]
MGILNRQVKPDRAVETMTSSVDLPAEMRAAMAAVTGTLDARRAVDDAIARNLAEQSTAAAELEQASAALTELDLAAALETDLAVLKTLEPKVDAARRAHDEAAQKVARIARLRVALAEKAREIDGRLAGDRTLFQIEAQAYGQQLIAVLGTELREAAKPLLAVLLKLHAATYGLGSGRSMVGLLEEVRLPSAVWGEQPLIAGSRSVGDDGTPIDLAQAWQDAPEAAALAGAMQSYAELRRRLAAHQDYREPTPPPRVHEQPTYQSKDSIERARRTEIENERRRAAAEAARPKAQPNSWTGNIGSVG